MFRLLSDVFHFLLWWCFLYVGSFMLMVVAIFYTLENSPAPNDTHYTTVQTIQPPKRVLVEREVCNRIDGCRIVNNVCVGCITVKN
jgi:hypothetical protein